MAGNSGARWVVKSNHLPKISAQLRPQVSRKLRTITLGVQSQAKQEAPVDTGTLRNSIGVEGVEPGSLTMTVYVSCGYGHFVNFGTRRMPARPYMSNAVERGHHRMATELATVFAETM